MTVPCSSCGGSTAMKQFTSKKGVPTTVFTCVSGCLNDKGYPLGTFPPRANAAPVSYGAPYRQPPVQHNPPQAQQRPISGTPNANEGTLVLKRIETQLKNIAQMLQKLSGHVPMQPEEMKPDDNFEPPTDEVPPF